MNTVGSNCSVPASEYQHWMFPIVYSMVLLLGLPGNLVALFVFTFKITPRTSSNVYIINLALADIGILTMGSLYSTCFYARGSLSAAPLRMPST